MQKQKRKLTREEFESFLKFLAEFGGFTDVDDPEIIDELWNIIQIRNKSNSQNIFKKQKGL